MPAIIMREIILKSMCPSVCVQTLSTFCNQTLCLSYMILRRVSCKKEEEEETKKSIVMI